MTKDEKLFATVTNCSICFLDDQLTCFCSDSRGIFLSAVIDNKISLSSIPSIFVDNGTLTNGERALISECKKKINS